MQRRRIFAVLWAAVATALAAGCSEDVLESAATVTDEFTQNAAAKSDVLWVIDNSESMAEEQAGIGADFSNFIDFLVTSQVDFHIGVISTDVAGEGRLHAPSGISYISPDTSDPETTFVTNVGVGTSGARNEKAFESTALALGGSLTWEPGETLYPGVEEGISGSLDPFLRDDASLFIIMVSDEDDKSIGTPGFYRRLFESYKSPGFEGRISVSAIIGPPSPADGCEVPDRGRAQPGDRYAELAQLTGGVTASICADFADSLNDLSITATRLDTVFELNRLPSPSSVVRNCGDELVAICVRVNGTVVNESETTWTYDSETNSISFEADAAPPPEATITMEYQAG